MINSDIAGKPGVSQARLGASSSDEAIEKQLLLERARELARPDKPANAGDLREIVEFRIGRERLAFLSTWVKEVVTVDRITPVPFTPAFVAGITMTRGRVLSLVDLRRILDLSDTPGQTPKALVLAHGPMEFGVLADSVEGVYDIPYRQIQPYTVSHELAPSGFLEGILPGPISLLDGGLLLSDRRMKVNHTQK